LLETKVAQHDPIYQLNSNAFYMTIVNLMTTLMAIHPCFLPVDILAEFNDIRL